MSHELTHKIDQQQHHQPEAPFEQPEANLSIVQLQRTLGNQSVQRMLANGQITLHKNQVMLQRQAANRPSQNRFIQRLKKKQEGVDDEVIDLSAIQNNYEELYKYRVMYAEKQKDNHAHSNYEFEDDDMDTINQYITALEANLPSIKCAEGEIKTAKADQGFDFGGVTSCMTITLVLDDGSKIAAHNGLGNIAVASLADLAGQVPNDRTVAQVTAVGGADYWTPDLEPQPAAMQRLANEQDPRGEWDKIAIGKDKIPTFVGKLQTAFGTQAATFLNHDQGTVVVSKSGKAIYDEVRADLLGWAVTEYPKRSAVIERVRNMVADDGFDPEEVLTKVLEIEPNIGLFIEEDDDNN